MEHYCQMMTQLQHFFASWVLRAFQLRILQSISHKERRKELHKLSKELR